MMKTLRRRFVVFAMTAVTLLLLFLIGAINGLNGLILEQQSNTILKTLIYSDEKFADGKFGRPEHDREPPFMPEIDLDILHAARFFVVSCDLSGEVLDIDIERISSVDEESALELAKVVLAKDSDTGRISGYKYAVRRGYDQLIILFMDNSGQSENFFRILSVSCTIAMICWLIVFIFVVLFSKNVVRPIIAGMEKQKQFITNAGHELKTPLAIIQSNNDAMSMIHGENKYNRNIRAQTKRLGVLMSDMLTLARLDEEAPLELETTNLSKLTEEQLRVYHDGAIERGLSFEAEIAPDITAKTSLVSFGRLITLILDNALKYTSDGGGIRISLTKQGGHILFIEENDCGSEHTDDPERLFERFYRGDLARTQTDDSGYGIGLSAARAICERLGGRLTAEYISNERIRFTARL